MSIEINVGVTIDLSESLKHFITQLLATSRTVENVRAVHPSPAVTESTPKSDISDGKDATGAALVEATQRLVDALTEMDRTVLLERLRGYTESNDIKCSLSALVQSVGYNTAYSILTGDKK